MEKKLEKDVKLLIAKILDVPRVKLDLEADLFKQLGADSLKAIEIIAAIEKRYRMQISLPKLVKIKTIAQLIRLVEDGRKK